MLELASCIYNYYVKIQFVIIFCYKSITGYTEVTRILVSRGQTLFFAQGLYRFQYKRPARKRVWESL